MRKCALFSHFPNRISCIAALDEAADAPFSKGDHRLRRPTGDETALFGDLSLPRTNERDMGHPLIRGTRTKNTRILFLLRKAHEVHPGGSA